MVSKVRSSCLDRLFQKGYINNPEKTAEAFFEFEGLPAYHTGDVGTMTDEGLLLYGGRMDSKSSLTATVLS